MSEPYPPLFTEVVLPVKQPVRDVTPDTSKEQLALIVKEICRDRGVRLLGNADHEVLRSERFDGWRIRLGMPQMYVAVEFEDVRGAGDGDEMLKVIDHGIKKLFQSHVDHIAKHWRDPLDRLTQLETAAKSVCDFVMQRPGDGRSLVELVYVLYETLRAKPGAVTWNRNGFGDDPKEKP